MNSVFLLTEAADVFGGDVVREARHHPAIVHFEGPVLAKPWHYLSKHPFRRTYAEHRAATPWPEVPVTGRTLGNRLLRPLPTRVTLGVLRGVAEVRRRMPAGVGSGGRS